jgi:GTP-binding protein
MRSAGNDDAIQLIPPKEISIETGLEIISKDEYLEVTPKSVRLRKKYLTENERIQAKRKEK